MKTYIIITAYFDGSSENLKQLFHEYTCCSDDLCTTLCADGGFTLAAAAGITPDLVIGDFDSAEKAPPENIKKIILPVEKDHTDTGMCIKHALSDGADKIVILGGIGGRLDHTIGNIQHLSATKETGVNVVMADSRNIVTIISNETITIKRKEAFKISLLSYSPICEDVCIQGVHYPLTHATLNSEFPLGVSNEFEAPEASVSVGSGKLLVIISRD